MKDKEYLIKFLLDKTVDLSARDDCAMDLADYDDEETLETLYICASDPMEDNIIQGTCGASLAEIMARNSRLIKKYVNGLSEYAFAELRAYFKNHKPEWLIEIQ